MEPETIAGRVEVSGRADPNGGTATHSEDTGWCFALLKFTDRLFAVDGHEAIVTWHGIGKNKLDRKAGAVNYYVAESLHDPMGLDSVELLMAVEEKFGISIPDAEASEILTVGDLHRCVIREIAVASKSSCLTQKAFHRLRRAAKELFGTPRSEFKPETKLDSILPIGSRGNTWRRLQEAVGATKWPDLRLSWLGIALALTFVFVVPWGLFAYSSGVLRWNTLVSAASALGLLIIMARAVKTLTRPFQTQFGQGMSTVGDLTYYLVAQNPGLVGVDRVTWTEDESWRLLVSVIKEQTGVTNFTKQSRIVDDLGID